MAEEKTALVSVLMPCCGMFEHTRLSLPRVLRHSRQPFELFLIDAGSLDGTREYLAGVADAAPVPVEVLRGQEGDFAALVEQALDRARGTFLAWVNNDVLVTEFWLQQMLCLVTAHQAIGAVGPMANSAGEQQGVGEVPYRLKYATQMAGAGREVKLDTQEVDSFARTFRKENRGKWTQVESLGGFCWLGRRAILKGLEFGLKRGESATGYGMGRVSARQVGIHLACCRDLFVHHFDSHPSEA